MISQDPFESLNKLTNIGTNVKDWYSSQRAADLERAQAQYAAQKAEMKMSKGYTNPAGLSGKEVFGMFKKAIVQQESGGNYGALGTVMDSGDRAYGKYQIMGNNIASWTMEVLGKSLTPQEFLHNERAQDLVGTQKLWQAYKTYDTPKLAAKSWFGGAGGVENPYPAVNQYGKDIMERMRDYGYRAHEQQPHPAGPGFNGDFVRPVMAGVTDPYGMRINPVTGERSFHYGTDYGAPGGSKVRAASDGRIISMGWDPIYGNQTIIRGPGGVQTMYGHQAKFNPKLEEGMRVEAGQRIGRVGSTGRSTGPHLHFEVQRGDDYINPQKFLRRQDALNWGQLNNPQNQNNNQNRGPRRPNRPTANSGGTFNPNSGKSSNLLNIMANYGF